MTGNDVFSFDIGYVVIKDLSSVCTHIVDAENRKLDGIVVLH